MSLVNPDELRLAAIECEHCEVRIENPTDQDLIAFHVNHPLQGAHQTRRMRRLEALLDRIATLDHDLDEDPKLDARAMLLVQRYDRVDRAWLAEWRRVHGQ